MFKHILIPLDGSRLAEPVAGIVASLAKRLKASVTLLHLIEKDAPSEVHSERHLVSEDEASAYLDEVAHLSILAGHDLFQLSAHRSSSDVAESIRVHSEELSPDLIGHLYPRRGKGPTAFVREPRSAGYRRGKDPGTGSAPSGGFASMTANADWPARFLPLSTPTRHTERSLEFASDLARAFHCRLQLLMVVPTLANLAGFRGSVRASVARGDPRKTGN